ncbi:aminoacylase-1-like [Periplaneta americana]|uniref:aminoacylase-1-like n=1 Tax=Periplaneta americana TaxID=6978 RepID=UPI0037E9495E
MNQAQRKPHELDGKAVKIFQEYLRIPTVHPDVNYDDSTAFLKRLGEEIGLTMKVEELVPGKHIVIFSWIGEDPSLPSILLNSHTDVVPVYEKYWTRPPFGAEKDEQGNIYARGAQDTKGVGMQYMEAIRRLKTAGVRLLRTVHVSFAPDEEIESDAGIRKYVHTQEFRDLNVGFAFDEGLPHPDNLIQVVYGERAIWQLTFHVNGTGGSAENILEETAAEKVRIIVDRAMEFRQTQKDLLDSDHTLTTGDVTTINLTMIMGGDVTSDEVPEIFHVTFDIRVAVTDDHDKMEETLQAWCKEAGPETYYTFSQKHTFVKPTVLDEHNRWWMTFKKECDAMDLNIRPVICPASGDSRFLRTVGIPTLGFAPMCNTPIRLHDHDEFLNENVFLRGIDMYCRLIPAMANLAP